MLFMIVVGLEAAFAVLFFTGQGHLAGAVLVTTAAFLAQNQIGARRWGTSAIWKYSLYSSLIASVLFILYLGLIELPVFITQEKQK